MLLALLILKTGVGLLKTFRTAGSLSMWVFNFLTSLPELTGENQRLNYNQLSRLTEDFQRAAAIFRVVRLYMLSQMHKLLNLPPFFSLVSF